MATMTASPASGRFPFVYNEGAVSVSFPCFDHVDRYATNYSGTKELIANWKWLQVRKTLAGTVDSLFTAKDVTTGRDGMIDYYTPLDIRWYMGRSRSASVVYCSLWLKGNGAKGLQYDWYVSASGSASGYGYDKQSAAASAALRRTGINLQGMDFGGAGDDSTVRAMNIVLQGAGYDLSDLLLVRTW